MLRMATAGLDSYCPACLLPCTTPVAAPAAPLHHPLRSDHLHSWDSQQQAAEQPVYVHRHSINAERDTLTRSDGSKSGKSGQAGGSNRGVVLGRSGRDVTAGRSDDREVIATPQEASDAQQHLLPSVATAEAGNVSEASSEQLLAWVSVSSSCFKVERRQYTVVTLLHAHATTFCNLHVRMLSITVHKQINIMQLFFGIHSEHVAHDSSQFIADDSDLAVTLECPGIDLSFLTGSLPHTFECPAHFEMVNTPYKYTALLLEKEKTTPFGVNLTRSQVLYRAAQVHSCYS